MRYTNTERLGVIEVDKIITKDIGWIFREQSVSDVGIDAIIEEVENNNPTGKLIAVQIKTGKGNFHLSEKKITYYTSIIHYNYWLSLNIPVLLIAHIPESEETYWIEINEKSLKKTKKKWKIEIPLSHKFNESSKNKLIKIISNLRTEQFELYKGNTENESIYDIAEKVECIAESTNSIMKIVDIIHELKGHTDSFNSKLIEFNERNLLINSPEVKARLKGFGRNLNLASNRLENEIKLFAATFSEGIISYQKTTGVFYSLVKNKNILDKFVESIKGLPESIINANSGIAIMRNGVYKLPKKIALLKDSRETLLEVIDTLTYELDIAKEMINKIIDSSK